MLAQLQLRTEETVLRMIQRYQQFKAVRSEV